MLICISIVGMNIMTTKPKYVGRVMVMERQPAQQGVPVYPTGYGGDTSTEMHLNDLGVIATSEKVLQRAARTLMMLNISLDPIDLVRTVKVEPVPSSQVLKIEVISEDREEAEAAADVVAAEFQRIYSEIMQEPTSKSREFIENQLPHASAELTKIRDKLRQFKEDNNIVELRQQSQIALGRSADFHNKLADARVEAGQAEAYRNAVSHQASQLSSLPEFRQVSRQVSRNPVYDSLVIELYKAQAEKAALEKGKEAGSKYPEMNQVNEKIANIELKLKGNDPMSQSSEGTGLDPLQDYLRENVLRANTGYLSASARTAALQQVVAEVDPELKTLPAKEMKLAKLLVDEEAAERTYRLLQDKLNEAKIKESESKNSNAIKIIEEAHVRPVDQRKLLKLGLAVFLSPMLSAAIVFLLNYLDNTVKTPAEAEELLALPVFAVVPTTRSHSLAKHKNSAALAEIYQILSANLWSNLDTAEGACVLVASAEPDTGRSVTASNLAITLAADGARVILVDADLRQPVQHLLFGVENKRGLSNILGGGALIEDVLTPTRFDGLLLMTAGPVPDNPVRLLRSPQMKTFIEQITAVADFIIFDSPAGIAFADTSIIASYTKNVVIAHAAGRVTRGSESEFRSRLEQMGANLAGAILNMVHPDDSHGYFHYRRAYQDVLPPSRRLGKELVGAGKLKAIGPDSEDGGAQSK